MENKEVKRDLSEASQQEMFTGMESREWDMDCSR